MTGRRPGDVDPRAGTPPFAGLGECSDVDPELFFPADKSAASAEPAMRICRGCAYQDPCLAWAVETEQNFGIWGGTIPAERDRIRKGHLA